MIPIHKVVSSQSDSTRFYYTSSQGNSIKSNVLEEVDSPVIGQTVNVATVETEPVDQILSSVEIDPEQIDFAILTVNGAEIDVLQGMEVTLGAGIHLAIAAPYSDGNEPYHQKIERFLKDAGYETVYENDAVYAIPP